MNEIDSSFVKASQILPLIHILSVIFLVCAQVCVIFVVRAFMREQEHESKPLSAKFNEIMRYFRRYEQYFAIFLALVCISGFFLSNGSDFKFSDPMVKGVTTTLWVAAGFIVLNFVYIHYKILSFKKAVAAEDEFEANEHLIIVVKYFIPLNVAITLICVYLGVTIGKF